MLVRPAVVVDDLTISARGSRLVDHVSFSVQEGESVALLGASGSGKSLTAAAVLGALDPSLQVQGRIEVAGRPVEAHGPAGRDGAVAGVYQDSLAALNPLVRIGVQLSVPLRRHSGVDRRDAGTVVTDLLASVGLEEPQRVARSFPVELSGGQRQRVCIALALVSRAALLVADEPTTALDVVSQARVLDVLRGHARTKSAATLFITHDLAVAYSLCDRAVVLADGRVVEDGALRDLVDRPQHPYTRALAEAASKAASLAAVGAP